MSYQKPFVSPMQMAVASSCCDNPNCELRDPCTYSVTIQTYTLCIGSTNLQ
jgi:hypothetical protein